VWISADSSDEHTCYCGRVCWPHMRVQLWLETRVDHASRLACLCRIAQKTLSSVVEHSTSASGESGSGTGLPGMRKRADLLGGLPSADPDPYGSGRMVVGMLPAGSQSRRAPGTN
jgi:hypothetical protein